MEEKKVTLNEANKYFGIELNQKTWELLGKAERSPDEGQVMIDAAHGSRYHWRFVGDKCNDQRAAWLISHVYAVLNMSGQALHYAKECKEITDNHPGYMKDFDLAYADEAMARALACNGNSEESRKYFDSALSKGNLILNEEEKKIFMNDLKSEPWYGIK